VNKIFNLDSPVMRGLGLISDLLMLNILTVLLSIPVVTIGAAVTALNDAANRLAQDEGHAFSNYWKAFKSNFKQATILWLLLLLVGALMLSSLLFYTTTEVAFGAVFKAISIALLVVWCVVATWSFQLQCRFENRIKNTLRNALLCSLLYLPRTVVATLLNMTPWLVLYFYTVQFLQFTPVWILIWFSMSAFLNAKVLAKPLANLVRISEQQQA
jgi:uncharacterized membrane protein YesL